jgi:hypothetical protein
VVDLLPAPAQLQLLARVGLAAGTPMSARERQLFEAVPHRHTHRGSFDPAPLLPGLQHDALAEGAPLPPVSLGQVPP